MEPVAEESILDGLARDINLVISEDDFTAWLRTM